MPAGAMGGPISPDTSYPDLIGYNGSPYYFHMVPASSSWGGQVTVYFYYKNQGASPSGSESFYVGFYISSSSTLTPSNPAVSSLFAIVSGPTVPTAGYFGGGSVTLTLPRANPLSPCKAGPYYLGMVLNYADTVTESNYSNDYNQGSGLDWCSVPITAPPGDAAAPASAFTPNMVRGAYGVGSYSSTVLSNGLTFGTSAVPGDGRGQTIAIIDWYDDPGAATDLTTFSNAFGLPLFNGSGDPTFTQLTENGQPVSRVSGNPNYVPTDPNGAWQTTGDGDAAELEESLDIEWAHAMAPMANIILFEATSSSNSDVYTAIQTATATPGVNVVSMSFGAAEGSGETSLDSDFTTPAGHLGGAASISTALVEAGNTVTFTGTNNFTAGESVTIADAAPAGFNGTYVITSATANSFTYADSTSGLGTATAQAAAAIALAGGITFLASSGDSGEYAPGTSTPTAQYPACSPNVVAVGGTTLSVSGSSPNYTYASESGWGNGTSSGTEGGGGGGTSLYESQSSYQNNAVAASNVANNWTISTTNARLPGRLRRCESQQRRSHLRLLGFWRFHPMVSWHHRGNEPFLPAVGGNDRDHRRGTRDCRPGVALRREPDPAGIVQNARGGHPRRHQRQ